MPFFCYNIIVCRPLILLVLGSTYTTLPSVIMFLGRSKNPLENFTFGKLACFPTY